MEEGMDRGRGREGDGGQRSMYASQDAQLGDHLQVLYAQILTL